MSRWLLPLTCLFALLLAGCSRKEPAFTDNSQDTELYAQSVRSMIERNCKDARSGDPSNPMAHLITELDRDDRPIGTRTEIFAELRRLSREAVAKIRASNGLRVDINKELDQMVKLAEQLPKRDGPVGKPPIEPGQ